MDGILNWDLGDASNDVNSNSFSHIYASPGDHTIKVYLGTVSGPESITSIDMQNDGIVGTINMSSLLNLTSVNLSQNPSLNSVIFPNSSTNISNISLSNSGLIGTLDISGLTGMSTSLFIGGNTKLTTVLNPSINGIVSSYYAYNTGLSGTLDLRPIKRLSGGVQIYQCPSLNSVLFSDTSLAFTSFYLFNDGLIGTLDISNLTGLGGSFEVQNNLKLNYVINPSTNRDFNAYMANGCGLMGTLDLRPIKRLGGTVFFHQNPSLNTVLVSDSSLAIISFYISSCKIIGTLDVSGLTGLGGDFSAYNNASLNTILNPTSSRVFNSYDVHECDLTGTLDCSGFTGLGGNFYAYTNPHLTQIINPNSSQGFSAYQAFDCSLSGTLDCSGLTNLGGIFRIENNRTLTRLLLPSTLNKQFTVFNAKNCSLNLADVDAIYSKLHALYDASAPVANIVINTDGGGNSWPTDGSSNVDYLGIYSAFNAAGKNASININYPGGGYSFDIGSGFDNTVYSLALDSSEHIYAGGYFTTYKGLAQNRLIRLNLDGTKDTAFDVSSGFNNEVRSLALDSSEHIYVGGFFTTYKGLTQYRLIRLNSDGTKDTAFDVSSGFNQMVYSLALDSSGHIYAAGAFTTYQGNTQNDLIRLNSDGTKDTTFNIGSGFNSNIYSLALDSSGHIYAGGYFTSYKGLSQKYLIRLNSDGSKDTTFDISSGFNNEINSLALDSNGHIYAAGAFTAYKDVSQNKLIRLNSDGTKDTTFDISSGFNSNIYCLALDSSENIYAGGYFTSYQGLSQKYLIRLNSDGSKDTTFDISSGFNGFVWSLALDSEEHIYAAGAFTAYKDVSQNGLIKLDPNGNKI